MTDEEKYWIEVCRCCPDDFVIVVDNDCAFVENLKTLEDEFVFEHWGWKLALNLFKYIGCNAEEA